MGRSGGAGGGVSDEAIKQSMRVEEDELKRAEHGLGLIKGRLQKAQKVSANYSSGVKKEESNSGGQGKQAKHRGEQAKNHMKGTDKVIQTLTSDSIYDGKAA
jgi:hypothetical protein